MKKLAVAALVGLCAATASPPAQAAYAGPRPAYVMSGGAASGPGWTGGCRIAVVNDFTPDQSLGGANVWNGAVVVAVAASTPGATVSAASCTIRVNGGTPFTILNATATGPVAVGAGRATFSSTEGDNVEICTRVTTSSHGARSSCDYLTTTPICPDQVCAVGGVIDQTSDLLKVVDPLVCNILVSLAGTVDSLPTAGVLYIDPGTGDLYVGGTGWGALFWDCPPYIR